MRIYQLFHDLISKFVPMDKGTQDELQLEAVNYYNKAVEETKILQRENEAAIVWNEAHKDDPEVVLKDVKPLPLRNTVIKFLEMWYMRYLIAIAFIYLVPLIKAYISGETRKGGKDLEDEEEEEDDSELFKQFIKFKRSMI